MSETINRPLIDNPEIASRIVSVARNPNQCLSRGACAALVRSAGNICARIEGEYCGITDRRPYGALEIIIDEAYGNEAAVCVAVLCGDDK